MAGKNVEDIVARIEALLFAASRPVEMRELLSVSGVRKKEKVISAIGELMKKYGDKGGAIELIELPGERFYLRLKREYHEIVKKYVRRPLFSRGVMKTLSFIAYHQPIEQSKVAAVRGNSAYSHIKLLTEKGLIEAEDKGKTKILRTSRLLADYLGVPNDPSTIRKMLAMKMNKGEERVGQGSSGDLRPGGAERDHGR